MLLEQQKTEAIGPGEILTKGLVSYARFVFSEGHSEVPVTTVLDALMPSDRASELFYANGQATDVVAFLHRLRSVAHASRDGHAVRLEILPLFLVGEVAGNFHVV